MPIRPKIIYVEDDAADAELFERNLAKSGVSAEVLILDNATCMSYLRRIALEDQELPDILIFDLKMPGEGGIGILRSVRELAEFDATPVVIFSGSTGPQEKAECLRIGASLCLEKPRLAKEWDQIMSSLSSFLAAR